MKNSINKELVPALRFPEFTAIWTLSKLADNTNWASGGTPSKKKEEYWGGDIPWISAISMKGHYFNDSNLKVTKIGSKNGTRIAKKDSILLLVRGSMLFNKIPVGITTRTVTFNQDVKAITVKGKLENIFLLHWFLAKENQLLSNVTGTGIGAGKLDTPMLQSLQLIFPDIQEQQKIANFLTSVDTKIQQLKHKHSLMQQYKKGVMQQLFSQQLRFKDNNGQDYPNWEEKRLEEGINLISGYPFKSKDITENNSCTPLMRGINITEGYIRHSTEIDRFYCGDIKKLGKYLVKAGDLVLGMDGSKVGKNTSLVGVNDDEALLVQRVARIRATKGNSINYFYQHIISSMFRNYVDKVNTSSGIPHISAKQIKDFRIPFPSEEEQNKISGFLTSIDQKIQQLNSQITQAETFKKGLLQQMFV